MIHFEYLDGVDKKIINNRTVKQWIKDTLLCEKYEEGAISVVFCGTDYHRAVNLQYLGHDYDTDVITFDYVEGTVVNGDILIGVDTVIDNAAQLKITPHDELLRVIIHGILHLCGYGDKEPGEIAVMRAKEDFYLNRYAL